MNKTIIIGYAGRDATLTYSPQGKAMAKVSVAVSEYAGKDASGAAQYRSVWFNCTVWETRAETFAKFVKKGDRLMVSGRVNISTYIDKNGKPNGSLELNVDDFEFLSPVAADAQPDNQGGKTMNGYARKNGREIPISTPVPEPVDTNRDNPDDLPF